MQIDDHKHDSYHNQARNIKNIPLCKAMINYRAIV